MPIKYISARSTIYNRRSARPQRLQIVRQASDKQPLPLPPRQGHPGHLASELLPAEHPPLALARQHLRSASLPLASLPLANLHNLHPRSDNHPSPPLPLVNLHNPAPPLVNLHKRHQYLDSLPNPAQLLDSPHKQP